jgi:hypothetical protein
LYCTKSMTSSSPVTLAASKAPSPKRETGIGTGLDGNDSMDQVAVDRTFKQYLAVTPSGIPVALLNLVFGRGGVGWGGWVGGSIPIAMMYPGGGSAPAPICAPAWLHGFTVYHGFDGSQRTCYNAKNTHEELLCPTENDDPEHGGTHPSCHSSDTLHEPAASAISAIFPATAAIV